MCVPRNAQEIRCLPNRNGFLALLASVLLVAGCWLTGGAAEDRDPLQGSQAGRSASVWSITEVIPRYPQDPRAKSGYVNEEYTIELIRARGFGLPTRRLTTFLSNVR